MDKRTALSGRRLERREFDPSARRQAERFDHPNQTEFGEPDFVDDAGHQYRLPFASRLGGWTPGEPLPVVRGSMSVSDLAQEPQKLWVRLKYGNASQWEDLVDETHVRRLQPLRLDGEPLHIRVMAGQRDGPRRRTGYIIVDVLSTAQK